MMGKIYSVNRCEKVDCGFIKAMQCYHSYLIINNCKNIILINCNPTMVIWTLQWCIWQKSKGVSASLWPAVAFFTSLTLRFWISFNIMNLPNFLSVMSSNNLLVIWPQSKYINAPLFLVAQTAFSLRGNASLHPSQHDGSVLNCNLLFSTFVLPCRR